MPGICQSMKAIRSVGRGGSPDHVRCASSPRPASSAMKVMLAACRQDGARVRCRRRPARAGRAGPIGAGVGRCVATPLPRRAVNQKVLPSPGSLSTPTCPPISSVSRLEMARPRPVPPYLRVVEASACEKVWNRRACLLLGHADAGVAAPRSPELDCLARPSSSAPTISDLALVGELDRVVDRD